MKTCWIFLFLVAAAIADTGPSYDYSESDYFYDDEASVEKKEDTAKDVNLNEESDKIVKEEISLFRSENEGIDSKAQGVHKLDANDYQIEDNRPEHSELNKDDGVQSEEKKEETKNVSIDPIENKDRLEETIASSKEQMAIEKDHSAEISLKLESEENKDNDLQELEGVDSAIIDETKAILAADDDEKIDFPKVEIQKNTDDLNKIIDDTTRLLAETSDVLDESVVEQKNKEAKISKEDLDDKEVKVDLAQDKTDVSKQINTEDEDTVDKVYADLNADLQKLMETWNKLKDESFEELSDLSNKNIEANTDKETEKPNDNDEAISTKELEPEKIDPTQDNPIGEDNKEHTDNANYPEYELIDDTNLSEIFKDKSDESDVYDESSEINDETEPLAELENAKDDQILGDVESSSTTESPRSHPVLYLDDALVAEDADKKEIEDKPESTASTIKTTALANLTEAEYDVLMKQFVVAHREDIQFHSESVAPIHIQLNTDEPVIITSPNFPSPYPTDNIIDWIFEGDGMGIELNITNFAINSALGDYVLVQPGRTDAGGTDALIFSYRLFNPRKFRFMDVDRMFIRFEAQRGMMFLQGFRMSVRMIRPIIQREDVEEPEAEHVVQPPVHTLRVNLAGLTLLEFLKVEEQFREIVSDMAYVFITTRGMDMGLNHTTSVTQIVSRSICNVNWPNADACVGVEFGVPLQFDDAQGGKLDHEDLQDMWTNYVGEEPFAGRLRSLGITEFSIPDDRSVLMVWLVIAAGVVVSMALLGLALWRFSCFENYSRMPAFSDTESLKNEKRGLDLYPTPHQSLPPLFFENEYQWSDAKYDDTVRADMGGFSNKSYVRDQMYDLDSDDEVVSPRRKAGSISRDYYKI